MLQSDSERIVDPYEESGQVLRKCFRTAPRAGGIEVFRVVIGNLRGENAGTGRSVRTQHRRGGRSLLSALILSIAALERHHLLELGGGRIRG